MGAIFKSVGSMVGSLLGMETQQPTAPAPVVTPATPMPSMDDAAVKAAKKKAVVDNASRRGRMSTILTEDNADTLGG
jgi:hypothetical protein